MNYLLTIAILLVIAASEAVGKSNKCKINSNYLNDDDIYDSDDDSDNSGKGKGKPRWQSACANCDDPVAVEVRDATTNEVISSKRGCQCQWRKRFDYFFCQRSNNGKKKCCKEFKKLPACVRPLVVTCCKKTCYSCTCCNYDGGSSNANFGNTRTANDHSHTGYYWDDARG